MQVRSAAVIATLLTALMPATAAAAVCTFSGEAMVRAAGQLAAESSATLIAAPATAPAPAAPVAGEEAAPAPPPPAPGRCEVTPDGVMAIARAQAIECRATLMGGIQLKAPWKFKSIKVGGDSPALLQQPRQASLETVLRVKAPKGQTMSGSIMTVKLEGPDECPKPRDLADILDRR